MKVFEMFLTLLLTILFSYASLQSNLIAAAFGGFGIGALGFYAAHFVCWLLKKGR